MKKLTVLLTLVVFMLVGCTSEQQLKQQMAKIIKEDPSIIIGAIEAKPEEFIEALNNAVKKAQEGQGKKREEEEKKQLEESFNNPLAANIRDEEVRGTKGAPITLVEYSDFECPFCSRGFNTVMELMEKYNGKIQFIYKHLPLSFHPQAMISAQYYEAIRMQDAKKAFAFHDKIYKNQQSLKNGEGFLKKIAQELKVDMGKLAKDVNSADVKKRIDEDMEEAAKYGFQGTPGFLINGVPVKGAYPTNHFVGIVDELKKRGKISL